MSGQLISRRDALKASAAFGGLALGGGILIPLEATAPLTCQGSRYPPADEAERQRYSYFQEHLPAALVLPDGSDRIPERPVSAARARRDADHVHGVHDPAGAPGAADDERLRRGGLGRAKHYRARDQFVFDCGPGVCANYGAMDVGFGRMDKMFLTTCTATT